MKRVNATTEILKLVELVHTEGYDANGLLLLDNGGVLDMVDNIKYASVEDWAAETIANESKYGECDNSEYDYKFRDGYDSY
jgi:hypothetical protein